MWEVQPAQKACAPLPCSVRVGHLHQFAYMQTDAHHTTAAAPTQSALSLVKVGRALQCFTYCTRVAHAQGCAQLHSCDMMCACTERHTVFVVPHELPQLLRAPRSCTSWNHTSTTKVQCRTHTPRRKGESSLLVWRWQGVETLRPGRPRHEAEDRRVLARAQCVTNVLRPNRPSTCTTPTATPQSR